MSIRSDTVAAQPITNRETPGYPHSAGFRTQIGMTPLISSMFILSTIAFAAYGIDKSQAIRSGRRIPEKHLHILTVLGGWPGALLGQRVFRHKTRKTRFLIVYWLCVLIHVGVTAWLMSQVGRPA